MKEDFLKNKSSQNEIPEIGDVSKLSDEEAIDILRKLNEEAIAEEEKWKFKSPEVMEICMKRPKNRLRTPNELIADSQVVEREIEKIEKAYLDIKNIMSEKLNEESLRTTEKKEKRGIFKKISNGFKRITNSLKGIFTSNTDTKMITEGKKDPIAQKADQEIKEIYDRQQAEKEKYGLTDEEYRRKIYATYSDNMQEIYNKHFKMTDEDVERLFDLSDGRETLRGKDEKYENLKKDYNNLSEEERKLNDRGKEM